MAANGNEECKVKNYELKLEKKTRKLDSNNIFEMSYRFDQRV